MCLLPTLLQPGVGESVWECFTNSPIVPIVECGGILSFVWVRAQVRQPNSEGQRFFIYGVEFIKMSSDSFPHVCQLIFGNHTCVIPCEDAANQKPISSWNCICVCMCIYIYIYMLCFFWISMPCHVHEIIRWEKLAEVPVSSVFGI